jgi:PAT family beta-lactamase induction signal transducer AmpG
VIPTGTPRSRLLLFAGLYFAQGVPWGFFTIAIMLHLANLGMGPAAIGAMASTAWLPYLLKPLLGPLVDRVPLGRFGHRRAYILLAEVGMAVSLLGMCFVEPTRSPGLFGAVLFVHNLFSAAQDVGTDALAIHILPPGERGSANGFMSAGKFAGVVVGGQGLLFVGQRAGWQTAYLAAIGLLLVPALLVLPVHEPDSENKTKTSFPIRDAVRLFSRPAVLIAAAFAVLVDGSDSLLFPLMYPLMNQQLGFSPQQVATLTSISGMVAALGSVAGGLLSDRLGHRRTLLLSCLGVAALDLVFMLSRPLWGSYAFQIEFAIANAVVSGIATAAFLALFMDLTDPRLAATQFQVYMSLANLRGFWGSRLGGWSAERFSPARMFGFAATIEVLPLLLLPLLGSKKSKAEPVSMA